MGRKITGSFDFGLKKMNPRRALVVGRQFKYDYLGVSCPEQVDTGLGYNRTRSALAMSLTLLTHCFNSTLKKTCGKLSRMSSIINYPV